MVQLLKRPQAEIDLEEIWWYIAQNNPKNADNFLDLILEQCLFLAQSPYSGKKRDELLQDLRSFPVRNYIFRWNMALILCGLCTVHVILIKSFFKRLYFKCDRFRCVCRRVLSRFILRRSDLYFVAGVFCL